MLVTVIAFIIVLFSLACITIRWVPIDCRMLVKRRKNTIVLKPGICFLIPFVDKVLAYAKVSYEKAIVCDFWLSEDHYRLVASFSLKDQDDFSVEDVEILEHFPEKTGIYLQELLENEDSDTEIQDEKIIDLLTEKLKEEYQGVNVSFSIHEILRSYDDSNS